MFGRRSTIAGGLVLAAAPLLGLPARAQAGRPQVVFAGHEL